MIPLSECKNGYVYQIRSRNLAFGVFNEKTKGFIGIRQKFESRYLATEYYDTGDNPFGTAIPIAELEKCPVEDLRESLGSICLKCKVPVKFVRDEGLATGKWLHLEETTCEKVNPCDVGNKELFKYLDSRK